MFDRQFFQSKLGKAALLSFAAMLAMNLFALSSQLHSVPLAFATGPAAVELA